VEPELVFARDAGKLDERVDRAGRDRPGGGDDRDRPPAAPRSSAIAVSSASTSIR